MSLCQARFLSKAKPETLHFGERKVCRCIFYQTQNQVTSDTATDTAQGDKLLGDPVAMQSLAAMVQATGVRLSPAIDREQQTTDRVRKVREKSSYLPIPEISSRCYAFSSNLPYYLYKYRHAKISEHLSLRASQGLAHFS